MLAWVAPGDRGDLGGQQVEDDAVLVGGPDAAVFAQEGRAGAFFAAKAKRAVQQAVDKVFEADRHFAQFAAEVLGDAVDHRAGDEGFADGRVVAPAGAVLEEVPDGDGQVVVGVHQPGAARDDAVAVDIGVVAKGDVEPVLEADQAGHGVG